MSKVAIQGNASGTGTLTIAAPNTNTDRTLTLPDSAGTVDTLQRAGNVLQVVQAPSSTFSTRFSTTSTSYVSTGHTLSITPSSASSKIFCLWSSAAHCTGGGYILGKFYRDGTVLTNSTWGQGGTGSWQMSSISFLDEPSSTSPVSYTLYIVVTSGTGYIGWQTPPPSSPSTNMIGWTLIEIAG
jgi:hypothetical protein